MLGGNLQGVPTLLRPAGDTGDTVLPGRHELDLAPRRLIFTSRYGEPVDYWDGES